ncbi:hypothetical protein ACJMK2_039781 [Sinanodonta woodiana]|uniref:Uncharacterized protein n=1 Tax=Sinanodonta woodiana TaxID=1069815 RepID=A0ABD3WD19_SINWO
MFEIQRTKIKTINFFDDDEMFEIQRTKIKTINFFDDDEMFEIQRTKIKTINFFDDDVKDEMFEIQRTKIKTINFFDDDDKDKRKNDYFEDEDFLRRNGVEVLNNAKDKRKRSWKKLYFINSF